jgi:hypothetical protein
MARSIGTSGAWKRVQKELREIGVAASHPRDIESALASLRATYEERVAAFRTAIEREISNLTTEHERRHAESAIANQPTVRSRSRSGIRRAVL